MGEVIVITSGKGGVGKTTTTANVGSALALKGKKVVNLNEAFEYLGQELQMEMTTIETNHEESTMSAEMMSSVIEKMKNENIQMILVDKNDNKTMAETIANETGAKIYELDSGLKGSIEKDAYINMVKYNMEILQN